MAEPVSFSITNQLIKDFQRERQLIDLIIKGCIELRWAMGDDEREMAEAIVYNSFEAYVLERGMSLAEAESFCETHLDDLINRVWSKL